MTGAALVSGAQVCVRALPFVAVVGQDDARLALLLGAVDPGLGGVLLTGEKGTAKTTLVRGLAGILPGITVVPGCRFSCDPAAPDPGCPDGPHAGGGPAAYRAARLVELPLGATDDRVTGSLDVPRVLAGAPTADAFVPGLLAAAHRGVLYVDEINLLPDHLVDVLLDAAATGVTTVEREGVSLRHASRFLLVGTMNPEEGELRPQLLDRFGLCVPVIASADPEARAGRCGPGWPTTWGRPAAGPGTRPPGRRWPASWPRPGRRSRRWRWVTRNCCGSPPRARRSGWTGCAGTWSRPGRRSPTRRGRACRRSPTPTSGRRPGWPCRTGGGAGRSTTRAWSRPTWTTRWDRSPSNRSPTSRAATTIRRTGRRAGGLRRRRRRRPADSGGPDSGAAPPPDVERAGQPAPARGSLPGGSAFGVRHLQARGLGTGSGGRRSRSRGPGGRPAGSVAATAAPDLTATLRAAALARPGGPFTVTAGDLRRWLRRGRESNLVILLLDTSGSMAARRRSATVAAVALSLLRDSYRRRDRVALLTFRGREAAVVVPPTRSAGLAAQRLTGLPTGGQTPLAAGLAAAGDLARREHWREPRPAAAAGRGDRRPGHRRPRRGRPGPAGGPAAGRAARGGRGRRGRAGPARPGRRHRRGPGRRAGHGSRAGRPQPGPARRRRAGAGRDHPREGGGVMPQGKVTEVPQDGLSTRQRRAQPLLAVHTGDGKGKSTAAFGLALRAWSAGWPIGVFQFTKSPKWKVGEEAALRALGEVHRATGQGGPVTWHKMGEGWSWLRTQPGTTRGPPWPAGSRSSGTWPRRPTGC